MVQMHPQRAKHGPMHACNCVLRTIKLQMGVPGIAAGLWVHDAYLMLDEKW